MHVWVILQFGACSSSWQLSEAHDRLLSTCAAKNLLQLQVYCGRVYVQTEPRGYKLITVNE